MIQPFYEKNPSLGIISYEKFPDWVSIYTKNSLVGWRKIFAGAQHVTENSSAPPGPYEEEYHDSMDGESYKCYFEKSICQNIPKHSVIVIDSAPYHSKNTENYPTSKWRKQQFVDWLTEKNITFPDKALRAELWTLVKSEREKFPDKLMETVAKEYGHEILSPPPPLPL